MRIGGGGHEYANPRAVMGQGSTFSAAARVEATWLSTSAYEGTNGAISYVPPPPKDTGCSNMCNYASDGFCEDGGAGAEYDWCDLGTDCEDCGPRTIYTPPASPPSLAPSLPAVISIRALTLPPTSSTGDCTVVLMPCEHCRSDTASKADDIGGTLVVSYRAPVGLDVVHSRAKHANLVEVQFLHQRIAAGKFGGGSDLYASLRTNDAYYVPWSGQAVAVCSHDDSTAQVAFAQSAVRVQAIDAARALCSYASPPPPTPLPPAVGGVCPCPKLFLRAQTPYSHSVIFSPLGWSREMDLSPQVVYSTKASSTSTTKYYLFKSASINKWLVGSSLSSTSHYMIESSSSGANCPGDVPSRNWQIWGGSAGYVKPGIDVECDDGPCVTSTPCDYLQVHRPTTASSFPRFHSRAPDIGSGVARARSASGSVPRQGSTP